MTLAARGVKALEWIVCRSVVLPQRWLVERSFA